MMFTPTVILTVQKIMTVIVIVCSGLKKYVDSLVNNAKNTHFKEKSNSCRGNIGATWVVVKEMIPGVKGESKMNFEHPQQKAEEFNEYFSTIGENASKKSQEDIENGLPTQNLDASLHENVSLFRPQPVDNDTVILTFKDLNQTNSFGSDKITLNFLRDSLLVLIFYVTIIINTSIVPGIFPQLWKNPHVLPYFKAGDSDMVENYRPISLLPILSKLL